MGTSNIFAPISHTKKRFPTWLLLLTLLIFFPMIYPGVNLAKADSVIATIFTQQMITADVAFDSTNGNLYVANEGSNSVSVISGQTNTVIGNPIPVGHEPGGIAFDSANGNLYVANFGAGTVSVISGSSNTVIGNPIPLPVGIGPGGIAFDSSNGFLYVADSNEGLCCGGTISVIATAPSQPPHTTITSVVDGNGATVLNGGTTVSHSIRITFSATPGTNPIAGFECSLDSSAFSMCSSPVVLTNLQAGKHVFQVRAVDTLGARDPTPASLTWTIVSSVVASGNTQTNAASNNAIVTSSAPHNIIQSQTQRNTIQARSLSPPIANAGPSQVVRPGALVVLNGAGSFDPSGGTIISYSWVQTSGPIASLSRTNTAFPTFTAPTIPTSLTFSLTVTDSKGAVSNPSTTVVTVA